MRKKSNLFDTVPHFLRKSILRTAPLPALKHLSALSGFRHDLCKFLFKQVQYEADSGCRALNEPGPKSFTRDTLLDFNPLEYHEGLCTQFPILMTVLTAVTCRGGTWEEAMQVLNVTARKVILLKFFPLLVSLTLLCSCPQQLPPMGQEELMLISGMFSSQLPPGSSTSGTLGKLQPMLHFIPSKTL